MNMQSLRQILCVGMLTSAVLVMAIACAPESSGGAAAERESSSAGTGEFPDSHYYYDTKRPAALRALEGKPAIELKVKSWIGEPQSLASLKGKVVVVDFWATWCGPCVQAIPHNIEMQRQHKDAGLVMIGVHNTERGSELMPELARKKGINYPLSVDDSGTSAKAYKVSFWPTYVVIDRKGVIRAAGLLPQSVDKVVEKLLAEA